MKIPLLLYPGKLYLGLSLITAQPTRSYFDLPLASGATLPISIDSLFLLASIVLLGVELVRQMNPRSESYVNHVMSALLALCATIGLLVCARLATTAWAAFALMAWVDVVVGVLASARLSSGRNVWIESK